MFRAKQSDQRHFRGIFEQIDRRLSLPVVASLIGDKANTLASERSEMILHEHIDAVEHPGWFEGFAMGWFGGIAGFVDWARLQCPGHDDKIKVADRLGRQCSKPRAKRADIALFGRMISVREKDHERL